MNFVIHVRKHIVTACSTGLTAEKDENYAFILIPGKESYRKIHFAFALPKPTLSCFLRSTVHE
jgi:hypothetical protein